MNDKKQIYNIKNLRNIGIIAHIDAGKTTFTERILFLTGKIKKIGEVHEGSTVTDWTEEERKRGITIVSSAITTFYRDKQINIIDTPGHADFKIEVERCLSTLDSVVVVLCAVAKVQSQTETVWREANKNGVPKIIFINKIDRPGSYFYEVIDDLCRLPNSNPVPLFLPVGLGRNFIGIIDILKKKRYIFSKNFNYSTDSIFTDEELEMLELYRNIISETLRENNLPYDLTDYDITIKSLRKLVQLDKINLVFCGSALHNKGLQFILDGIIDFLPSPSERNDFEITDIYSEKKIKINVKESVNSNINCARIFKIVDDPYVGNMAYMRVYSGKICKGDVMYNVTRNLETRIPRLVRIHADKKEDVDKVFSGDIIGVIGLKIAYTGDTICDLKHKNLIFENLDLSEPVLSATIKIKNKRDMDKFSLGSKKILYEDPGLKIKIDRETFETRLFAMGKLHMEIFKQTLKRRYDVDIDIVKPEVAYQETITKSIFNIEGKYIKQSGGRGQYGHVVIDISSTDKKFEFINDIKSGVIDRAYFPDIKNGIMEFMESGMLCGYRITGLKVRLFDGSFHPVDSSSHAFKSAIKIALRKAYLKSKPVILEPIMKISLFFPKKYYGKVMSEFHIRRGKVLKSIDDNITEIKGLIPLDTLETFQPTLLSLTEGRGSILNEGKDSYDIVPEYITNILVEKYSKNLYKK